MLTFEEAGEALDAACEALPQELFEGLNGGVSLQPEVKRSEDGRYIMGLYHDDMMGRWIEIFYGSFAENCADKSDDELRAELVKTLKHELTHHLEGKAWEHGLADEDERETAEWRRDQAETAFHGGYEGRSGKERMRRRRRPQQPWGSER